MLVIEFTICFGDRIHALRKIVVFQSYILIFADKLVGYLISFINKTKDFLYHIWTLRFCNLIWVFDRDMCSLKIKNLGLKITSNE